MKTHLVTVMTITAVLTMTTAAWGQGLIADNADLPPDGDYVSPNEDFKYTVGTGILIEDPVLRPAVINVTRDVDGDDEFETFGAQFDGSMSIGGTPKGPIQLTGQVQVKTTGRRLSTTGIFDTEIVSMSLSGNTGAGFLMMRQDPQRPSTGQTDINDIGGGLYQIDSFFDVFTEVSVDGGNNWTAADSGVRMDLTPEPGTLGLLALGGMAMLRRRRKQ